MSPATPPAWLAGADGIAHAQRRWSPRASCGRPAIRENEAWPARSRCQDCDRAEQAAAARSAS